MPKYEITGPDGKKYEVEAPEGATEQQAIEYIKNTYYSDRKPEKVTQPVDFERAEIDRNKHIQKLNENMGTLESLAIASGRGFNDVLSYFGLTDKEPEQAKAAFKDLEEKKPISQTVGRALGQSAPFLVPSTAAGAITGLGARAATMAAVGAAEGAIISDAMGGSEDENIKAAGIGGALAGGLELVSPVLGRVARQLINKHKGRNPTAPIFRNGKASKELQEALSKEGLTLDDFAAKNKEMLESGQALDKQQAIRKAFLEEQGIVPTKAQVTGDVTDFQEQQELIKKSGAVRNAIVNQDFALADRFQNAVTATGGTAVQERNPIFDFIADKAIEEDAAINQAYKEARELALDEKVVRPENFLKTMRKFASDETLSGGVISSAKGALRNNGVLIKPGYKAQSRITPEAAQSIRQEMNAIYKSASPRGRQIIKELKDAIDNDVIDAVGEDVFAPAIELKREFEKSLSRAKVNKFDQRQASIVRDILENKVNPDNLTDKLALSKATRVDDVKQVKNFLISSNDDRAIEAWNSFRAETMDLIKNKAISYVNDEPSLSRDALDKIISRIGTDKLKVIFTEPELKFLRDMKKIAALRQPKRMTQQGKGPSAQAVAELLGPMRKTAQNVSLIAQIFGDMSDYLFAPRAIKAPLNQKPQLSLPSAAASALAVPLAIEDLINE